MKLGFSKGNTQCGLVAEAWSLLHSSLKKQNPNELDSIKKWAGWNKSHPLPKTRYCPKYRDELVSTCRGVLPMDVLPTRKDLHFSGRKTAELLRNMGISIKIVLRKVGRKSLWENVWPLNGWIFEWWATYLCFFPRETLRCIHVHVEL